jgi:2-polyprenyl-3-methyl-5-hydroxy-6-metoxy-1,4-benzoquinol methylase
VTASFSIVSRKKYRGCDAALQGASIMDVAEDCYGRQKKINLLRSLITEKRPQRILDIGCGTGTMLTRPLAEAFPEVEVVGVDTDVSSIVWANARANPSNLSFSTPSDLLERGSFDIVIASEVLEHVEEPLLFLDSLRAYLSNDGRVILTTPNGYGPFEAVMFVAVLLHGPLLKRRLAEFWRSGGAASCYELAKQTLAISPHVNFFRLPELRDLFASSGLHIEQYRPTTLLAGPGIGSLLHAFNAIEWNARICDMLPHWCASGWMFVLKPAEPDVRHEWHRGPISRLRRELNLTRWRAAQSI